MAVDPPVPAPASAPARALAVVVIGRNEGERLRRCLDTLVRHTAQIVYVDSGSTDGSVQTARSRAVDVLDLDMTRPFTAARARNAGFARVRERFPEAVVVQFVDGDCDVHPQWLAQAAAFLEQRADVVAVYGTLREAHPEVSIYNLQCDLTWNPHEAGETDFFGGNVALRVAALEASGGFREDLIDSEDHDLAIRLRRAGGKVWYLEQPMAVHDLGVREFSRWWTRTVRGGYGNGFIVTLHPQDPGRARQREWSRNWLWGLGVPALSLVGVVLLGPLGLMPLLLYGVSFLRMYLRPKAQGGRHARYAAITVMHKIAEMVGQLRFLRDRWLGRHAALMEYK